MCAILKCSVGISLTYSSLDVTSLSPITNRFHSIALHSWSPLCDIICTRCNGGLFQMSQSSLFSEDKVLAVVSPIVDGSLTRESPLVHNQGSIRTPKSSIGPSDESQRKVRSSGLKISETLSTAPSWVSYMAVLRGKDKRKQASFRRFGDSCFRSPSVTLSGSLRP